MTQGVGPSYGTDLLVGVERAARKENLSLLVRLTGGDQKCEEAALREMQAQDCLGIILYPVNGESYSAQLLELYLSGMPIVLVDRYFPGLDIPAVTSDNTNAAKMGVSHLLDLGHREILLLSPEARHTVTIEERIAGYVAAFTERGLAINHSLILDNLTTSLPFAVQSAAYSRDVERVAEVLRKRSDVSAVMALEYNLAIVAHAAAQSCGRAVPEDLSIVCFDHPPYAPAPRPFFTHLLQNERGMGEMAVERLLALANAGTERDKGAKTGRTLLPVQLVQGDSTQMHARHTRATSR